MSRISLRSLPESDNEFWQDLNLVSPNQIPELKVQVPEIPLLEIKTEASVQEFPLESSRQVDRLHKQIETLRCAKEVEVKNAEIVLRKNLQVNFK